jgi:predicted HAD superfamily phosphohydrolase YqeG
MLQRFKYTLKMLWRYRAMLKAYRHDPLLHTTSVIKLNPSALKLRGIRILVLDFDGVLASHGETLIEKEIQPWLQDCLMVFGHGNLFILSNKPTEVRLQYFNQFFPGIIFVKAKRKKPYPDGLLEILALKKETRPEVLLMVDDRLFTGILAAIIANTRACYITKPLISLTKRPFHELFFMGLRALEHLIIH